MKVVGFVGFFIFTSSSCILKPSRRLGRMSNTPGGLINKSYFRVPCRRARFEKYRASCLKRHPNASLSSTPKGLLLISASLSQERKTLLAGVAPNSAWEVTALNGRRGQVFQTGRSCNLCRPYLRAQMSRRMQKKRARLSYQICMQSRCGRVPRLARKGGGREKKSE